MFRFFLMSRQQHWPPDLNFSLANTLQSFFLCVDRAIINHTSLADRIIPAHASGNYMCMHFSWNTTSAECICQCHFEVIFLQRRNSILGTVWHYLWTIKMLIVNKLVSEHSFLIYVYIISGLFFFFFLVYLCHISFFHVLTE